MAEETAVPVRFDRVAFCLLESKVKWEPGSVAFMLSRPCVEKTALDCGSASGRMLTCIVTASVLPGHVLAVPHNLTIQP